MSRTLEIYTHSLLFFTKLIFTGKMYVLCSPLNILRPVIWIFVYQPLCNANKFVLRDISFVCFADLLLFSILSNFIVIVACRKFGLQIKQINQIGEWNEEEKTKRTLRQNG